MKKKKYPYRLVEVYWTDAQSSHGWEDDTPEVDTPLVLTVGFLIKESETGVRIASTIGNDNTNNSRIDIPVKMIESIKDIK